MIDGIIAEVVLFDSKLMFVNRFKNNFLSSATLGASTISAVLSKIFIIQAKRRNSRKSQKDTEKKHRLQDERDT